MLPDPSSLDGQSILVTGATGSFGQHFVRSVLKHSKPERLIVFSRDELKQYQMQSDPELQGHSNLRFFIGDVRDSDRLDMAMRDTQIVVHAAALKHIPAAEYNPFECIRTNVHGAENVVTAAIRNGVHKVIALSTDKAANPINLYGASKLAADKIFVSANNLSGKSATRFSVVRYGNVVGSRGSVIPYFRKLIEEGADHLPITDSRMTRFWITLDEGIAFVLSCITIMGGGEIFVPKIRSTKITDIATTLAPHLPHKIIGIRPGEKLHEVLITEDDSRTTIDIGDRYVIQPQFPWWWSRAANLSGNAVQEGFKYSSDTNAECIDADEILAMLQEA